MLKFWQQEKTHLQRAYIFHQVRSICFRFVRQKVLVRILSTWHFRQLLIATQIWNKSWIFIDRFELSAFLIQIHLEKSFNNKRLLPLSWADWYKAISRLNYSHETTFIFSNYFSKRLREKCWRNGRNDHYIVPLEV